MHKTKNSFRSQLITVFLVLFTFGACSTPNLKPFADGASNFATEIRQTNTAVESKFSNIPENLNLVAKRYQNTPFYTQLNDNAKNANNTFLLYRKSSQIYNDMAGLAAAYSTALADLASAGESGGQAAKEIVATVNGFTNFLGLANPAASLPTDLAGDVAGRAIQKAAEVWTRVEAHEKLLNTMKDANNAVQALSVALVEVYGRPRLEIEGSQVKTKRRPFEKIIRSITSMSNTILSSDIGITKLDFYNRAEQFLGKETYKKASIALMKESVDDAQRAFKAGQEVLKEKERIDDEVGSYKAALKVLDNWQELQLQKSYLIADTALAWAEEHNRLLGWFKTCGGVRFLKNECGQFSATTLKTLAAEIQFITKGGN